MVIMMNNSNDKQKDEEYRRKRRERQKKKKQRESRRRKITLILTFIILILLIVLTVKILSSCKIPKEADVNTTQATQETVSANPIAFDNPDLELTVGNIIRPLITDSLHTELSAFTLQSENENIVGINENNELVAKSEGEVKITCTATDGRTAECTITVKPLSTAKIRKDLDPDKPMVALTFDDGPNGGNTLSIMDSLNKYNGRATFFMAGYKISEQPDIVKKVSEQGHEVANHSRDHLYADNLSESQQQEQMESVNEQVKAITGEYPTLFRCPGNIDGVYYRKSNMPLISWSIDTMDWKTKNSQSTYEAITKVFDKGFNLDGDIVLMHDLQDSTPSAVEKICKYLDEKGYQMVTVSELAHYRGVELQGGEIYNYFYKNDPVHNYEKQNTADNNDSNNNNENASENVSETPQ